MYNFRTDLADERREIYKKTNNIENEIDGIEVENEKINNEVNVSKVKIINNKGEESIGKPIGTYITIDVKNLKIATEEEIQGAAEVLSKQLKILVDEKIQKSDDVLVVGLGNIYVTPDALGPKVVNNIDVTRHLINYVPQYIDKGTRPITAIAPGVLGTTGIETLEILKGIVDNVHPKLLIIIDSLASRSIERISTTIQVGNTGIVPGAGIGNKRKELSMETLGIPVIAVGVPTVVEAATIAADSLNLLIEKIDLEIGNSGAQSGLKDLLDGIKGENKYELIKEVLNPSDYNFIVTPKEIDDLIENMSGVVARGINMCLA